MASAAFQNTLLFPSILAIFTCMVIPATLSADVASIDTPVPEAEHVAIDSLTIEDGARVELDSGASRLTQEKHFIHLEGETFAIQDDQINRGWLPNLDGGRWSIAPGFGDSYAFKQEELPSGSAGIKDSSDTPQIILNPEMFEKAQDGANWLF